MNIVTQIKQLSPNKVIVYVGFEIMKRSQWIHAIIGENYEQISRQVNDLIIDLREQSYG